MLYNSKFIFNIFDRGVLIIVGTAKRRQHKMGAVLLKSSIGLLSMLHTDCYYVIIGITPCHQKAVLSISPQETVWDGGISLRFRGDALTAPDRLTRADWQHKFPLTEGLFPYMQHVPETK